MKKKSNIGWWIAGAAALFLLKKKATESIEGIGRTIGKGRYVINIRPNGTNYEKIYGRYSSYDKAVDALRNIPFAIRRSCAIHLVDSSTGGWID